MRTFLMILTLACGVALIAGSAAQKATACDNPSCMSMTADVLFCNDPSCA